MPEINQLTAVTSVSSGDQLPIYSSANGDARKCSVNVLATYMQDNLNFGTGTAQAQYVTQYAAPAATGFTVNIDAGTDGTDNVWLILTPLAGYAAGTITLPAAGTLNDRQLVNVNCTQSVTTLTVALNGAVAAVGAPTTLAANAFFTLRYDAVTNNWYRVG